MKRLLALLLACLLLVLNACGTPTEDAANTEPSELTAEELPESCRRWFDIAASSGTAEPDSQLPFAEKGHDCTSEIYGVHMPDGKLYRFDPTGVSNRGCDGGSVLQRRREGGDQRGAAGLEW